MASVSICRFGYKRREFQINCMKMRTFVNSLVIYITTSVFSAVICDVPGPCALLDTGTTSVCISLDEINAAFRQARLVYNLVEPIKFSPHKAHHHLHEVDLLGNVLVEASRILAKNYHLDDEQIYNVLPQLDVELTDIWKFCPAIFKPKKCKVSKYRTLSGYCNNLNHPEWGAALTPFQHVLSPERHDGLSEPREYGKNRSPLPSSRVVSSRIHQDKVVHDHAITTLLIAWGQIVDHDITFTGETKDASTGKDPECCFENIYESSSNVKHHNCYPIQVPHDDPFYSYHQHYCMNFLRSLAGVRTGCRLGPRTSFNSISSFLDASFLYGSHIEMGKQLRSMKYGALLTLPLFKEKGLKDLLPLKIDQPDDGCIRPNSDIFCFLAGDTRVNEQLVLTTVHTIFVREHNKIAHTLAEINTNWDDEKLYQETRKIIIGIVQHITYNEFLPMILGRDVLHEYGLSVEEGYWTGYDPYTNPGAFEEFITAAFRFGHSLLPHRIERWTTTHHQIDSTKLHEMLRQPFDMFRPGYADTYIMGLVNQLAQVMDEGVTDQVTTLLFKEKGKHFGMDLAAMNIQRGRDHGVLSYAAYRKVCGLSPIHDWDDLIGIMKNETVYQYKHIYGSPWDIDLWSGGVSEIPKAGALLGPTFGCLIAKQFKALRYGDRFWYELPDLPSSFTLDQLNEIKSMKLSRLLCDNGDNIRTIQVYAMVHPDHNINPRVSCHSKVLPSIDLEKWRESTESISDHDSDQTVLQKAHLHTDLETLKPPLYDGTFIKLKSNTRGPHEGKSLDKIPEAHDHLSPGEVPQTVTSHKPIAQTQYDEHTLSKNTSHNLNDKHKNVIIYMVPPFRKIPTDEVNGSQHEHGGDGIYSTSPHDGFVEYGFDNFEPPPPHFPPFPSTFRGPLPPPLRPSLLSLVNDRSNLLTRIFRRRRKNRHFRPFPPSPFPGMGGIYSPNPGYLVRQQFRLAG